MSFAYLGEYYPKIIKYKTNDLFLLTTMEPIMPYKECYVETIDYGGFKDKKDHAVKLRKAAYQFLMDNFDDLMRKTETKNLIKVFMHGFSNPP